MVVGILSSDRNIYEILSVFIKKAGHSVNVFLNKEELKSINLDVVFINLPETVKEEEINIPFSKKIAIVYSERDKVMARRNGFKSFFRIPAISYAKEVAEALI